LLWVKSAGKAGTLLGRRRHRARPPIRRMEPMKRAGHPEACVEHWSVGPEDWPRIEPKQSATRLVVPVLCKFFQYAG